MPRIKCHECDGEGEYEVDEAVVDYTHGGYIRSEMVTCDNCDGDGTVEGDYDEE